MKTILLLVTILMMNTAHAAITYSSSALSPSLNEYSHAVMTDENSNKIPMMAVVIAGSNGESGIASNKLDGIHYSSVTGRPESNLYKASGGKKIPVVSLVKMNTSTNVPEPLTLLDSSKLVAVDCAAYAGGAASAALTCTGLAATDTILAVSQKTAGANSTAIIAHSALGTNTLTVAWTADPGAGAVVKVLVKKL